MTDDFILRSIVMWGMVGYAAGMLIYRPTERGSREGESWAFRLSLRLCQFSLIIYTCAFVGGVLVPHFDIPLGLRYMAATTGLCGIVLALWAVQSLGLLFVDSVIPTKGTPTVIGAYALVRHPFYAGLMVMMFSLMVITQSAGVGVSTLMMTFLLIIRAAREESHFVSAGNGEVYLAYMQMVGRFLP